MDVDPMKFVSTDSPDDARKLDEIDFHNHREVARLQMTAAEFVRKYPNKRWYSITRKSRKALERWMGKRGHGTVGLDYCCGIGQLSLDLAKEGAQVHGIDISDEEIGTAREAAAAAELSDRVHFAVMDAENLDFEDQKFDFIICSGVLHHLDLDLAYPELSRVLKPDGSILCIEAVGHNPIFNLYRRRTPHLRTPWEIDHILKIGDVRHAGKYFSRIDIHFYHLFALLAVPLRNTPLFCPALSFLDAIDAVVLRVPLLQLMAWQMIFELSGPK